MANVIKIYSHAKSEDGLKDFRKKVSLVLFKKSFACFCDSSINSTRSLST